jgi:hypothetical protein
MKDTVFLHQRVRSIDDVQRFSKDGQRETEILDFKREPWKAKQIQGPILKKAGLEASKDVAALANCRGGDIIIGIADDKNTAGALMPIQDVGNVERSIRQILRNHLRPGDFVEALEYTPLQIPAVTGHVLVISIPASAELIGVEDPETSSFSYPVRDGEGTKWLAYSEVMMRLSATTRATYLRLRAAQEELHTLYVRFSSPVVVQSNGTYLPVVLPQGEDHGQISDEQSALNSETVTFNMRGFFTETGLRPSQGGLLPVAAVKVPADKTATIPLHLIRTSWIQHPPGREPAVYIALDGQLVWTTSWTIRTGVW